MRMENELYDKPGLIITDKVIKTTKVKKFIIKNKLENYKVIYLDPVPTDFRDVERGLKELENNYLGLEPIKEKPKDSGYRPYTHVYRVDPTTTLCAYSQEDLDKLKYYYAKSLKMK